MNPINLLLFEDDEGLAKLMKRQLRRNGYQVTIAHDGIAGLEILTGKEDFFQIIILDFKMPRLDGLGVLKELQARKITTPAIMLSSVSDLKVVVQAMKLGAVDYVIKDVDDDPALLHTAISKALEKAQLKEALFQSNERLRESEEKFRAMTEHTSEITAILDHGNKFIYISPSITRLTKRDNDQLLSQSPKKFIHPEDMPFLLKCVEAAWAKPGETIATPDFRAKARKARKWHHFSANLTALPNTPGVNGLIANCRDITQRKEAEWALKQEKQRIEQYLEITGTIILALDREGKVTMINPSGCKVLNQKHREIIGRIWVDQFVPDEQATALRITFSKLLNNECEGIDHIEGKVLTKEGHQRIISWSFNPICNDERVTHILLSGIDITSRKQTEAALAKSEQRYELATLAAKVGVWDWDLMSNEMYIDPNFKNALGFSDNELQDHPDHWWQRIHPEDRTRVWSAIEACLKGMAEYCEEEHRMLCKDGSIRWFITRARSAKDSIGNVIRLTGTDTDITDFKLAELQIEHMATHDALTTLPNRLLLMDRLVVSLARAHREKHMVAVMFIDLDGFKPVNDTFGHDAGDEVLRQVAYRLENSIRASDTVARFGGDEFIVTLSCIQDADSVAIVARKILKALEEPVDLGLGHEPVITASIGIALYPRDGDMPEQLVKKADAAMYEAKTSGKCDFRFARSHSIQIT